MTSIHTELALLKYFTQDSFGHVPAYHRNDLYPSDRRELIEALIDFYLNHKHDNEACGGRGRPWPATEVRAVFQPIHDALQEEAAELAADAAEEKTLHRGVNACGGMVTENT